MSVTIKSMDLPNSCEQCRFAVDGWCYANDRANVEPLSRFDRPKWCPLGQDKKKKD